MMNIPAITDIDTALSIYYNNPEIGNTEIISLFGNRSTATIARLKQLVRNEMIKNNICTYGANKVKTEIAYTVWGLDVSDLETRRKKLKALQL